MLLCDQLRPTRKLSENDLNNVNQLFRSLFANILKFLVVFTDSEARWGKKQLYKWRVRAKLIINVDLYVTVYVLLCDIFQLLRKSKWLVIISPLILVDPSSKYRKLFSPLVLHPTVKIPSIIDLLSSTARPRECPPSLSLSTPLYFVQSRVFGVGGWTWAETPILGCQQTSGTITINISQSGEGSHS